MAFFFSKKTRGISCPGCIKCFKAFTERNGEFSRYQLIKQLFSLEGCFFIVSGKQLFCKKLIMF